MPLSESVHVSVQADIQLLQQVTETAAWQRRSDGSVRYLRHQSVTSSKVVSPGLFELLEAQTYHDFYDGLVTDPSCS